MRHVVNSRADLENLRGTADFEDVLRGLHGAFTTWSLVDGAWVAQENLSVIERFDYDKAGFLAEIEPFDFPAPVPPDLPVEPEPVDPLTVELPRREFRLALLHNGMDTAAVLLVINAIPDPEEREEMTIWWEDTQLFQRQHPILVQMVAAAGITPEQGDVIWTYGVGLLQGE